MKRLNPIILGNGHIIPIEQEIQRIFNKLIYQPLLKVLGREIQNSNNPLVDAIRSERIWYDNGAFYGRFNAKISLLLLRLGATFDKQQSRWLLPREKLTPDILVAQANAQMRVQKTQQSLLGALDAINVDNVAAISNLDEKYNTTIDWANKTYTDAVKSIAIAPILTDAMQRRIADEWAENLDLYIKKWSEENILALREKIKTHALHGGRAEGLERIIRNNYNVSQSKAKFLARQETSLAVSKFHESRFADVGITNYIWGSSGDERERPDHRLLNGKMFAFSLPPITDRKTGARNNPGEDFGCFPGNSKIKVLHDIEKCFRRWYCGKLTEVITESGKTIRATPNHPILTLGGWKPIGLLDSGDNIVYVGDDLTQFVESDCNKCEPTIREIFQSNRKSFLFLRASGKRKDFHGDGSAYDIDIIDTARKLSITINPPLFQRINNFFFSFADTFAIGLSRVFEHLNSFDWWYSLCSLMGSFSKLTSFFKCKLTHPDFVGLTAVTNSDIVLNQSVSNSLPADTELKRNSQLTFSSEIGINNNTGVDFEPIAGSATESLISIRTGFFMGHVYNLQTSSGYYTSASVVVSNCRCFAIPVVD